MMHTSIRDGKLPYDGQWCSRLHLLGLIFSYFTRLEPGDKQEQRKVLEVYLFEKMTEVACESGHHILSAVEDILREAVSPRINHPCHKPAALFDNADESKILTDSTGYTQRQAGYIYGHL